MALKRKWEQHSLYNQPAPLTVDGGELQVFTDTKGDLLNSAGLWSKTTNGTIIGVRAGEGINQRIGREISIHQLYFRGAFIERGNNPTARFRLIIYIDHQTNSLDNLAITDILNADEFDSNNNITNSKRFTILTDFTTMFKAIPIWDGSVVTFAVQEELWEYSVRFDEPLIVRYSSDADSATAILENNVSMIFVASEDDQHFRHSVEVRYRSH